MHISVHTSAHVSHLSAQELFPNAKNSELVYAQLKDKGVNTELVTARAKDKGEGEDECESEREGEHHYLWK